MRGSGFMVASWVGLFVVAGCDPEVVPTEAEQERSTPALVEPAEGSRQASAAAAARLVAQLDEGLVEVAREKPVQAPRAAELAPPASTRLALSEEEAKRVDASKGMGAEHRFHIQLDKPLYQPGESIWVKVWELDGKTFTASSEKGEVKLSLFDGKGVVLAEQRLESEGGLSHTVFDLMPGCSGGEYRIAVESGKWRRERSFVVTGYEPPRIKKQLEFVRKSHGAGDEVQASLKLERANGAPLAGALVQARIRLDGVDLPNVQAETDADGDTTIRFTLPEQVALGDGLLTVLVEDGGVTESISKRIPIIMKKMRLDLFPEGGHLVLGLPSRVYFEARTPLGKPADLEAVLVDGSGAELASFRSLRDGLGRFELTPQKGERYSVKLVRPAGVDELYPLPEAKESGCVLRSFDDYDGGELALRVGVRCSTERTVVVAAALRGNPLDLAKLAVKPGEFAVAYLQPTDEALAKAQGIAQVTVYDEAGAPLAERLVYRNRRNGLSIEIEADQERYTPRDKVTLTVTTKDASGKEVPAELALAVVDDTVLSFADDKRAQLLAAMYLSPELPSLPEEPNYYFDLREEDGAEAMDLLMGSRGWRGFEKVAVAQSTETVEEPKPQLERPKRQEQNLAGLLNAQEAVGFDALAEADVAAPPYGLGMAGAGRGGGGVQAEGFGIGRFGVVGRGGGGGAVGRDFALGEPDVGGRVPRLKPGKPEVLGSMDKRIIQKVVNQHRQRLRHCYERELLTHPELSGKIVLKWVIQPTGDVSSVQLLETTMNNQSVENCVTQVVMRFRFPETKGGGLVIVTYPFVFETFERPAMPQWEAAPQAVQLPLTKLETVRVFPLPDYSGAFDGVRNDFRETVFWNPRVKTNEQGHAELSFYLSDTVGSFRVSAEGFGASQLGRAEKVLSSTLPFSMSVKLPLQVSSGDMVLMPVSFENERALEVEVQLSADFGPMLRLANAESQRSITLPPRGRESLVFGLEVVGVQGQNPVRLVATASGLSDAFERQLEVAPRGFPASMVRSGRLAESETIAFAVDGALPGTTRAQLRLLPGALANMRASYESMLRQPTGCFEQASSSHFPNVMIMGFLQRQGGLEPELLSSTKALLDDGYRKLSAFETSERAFEWFGGAPAHEALSAYGLLEFVEMHRLGLIDAVLIERTASWLLGRRDGKGGYLRNERALDSFGRASAEVTNAYITYAMVQAGYAAKLERELDAQRRLAEDTRDVYVLGLAANTLLSVDTLRAEGESATARLAALQDADGAFSKADHSITRSQGLNLQLESTALALMAMLQVQGNEERVQSAMDWLMDHRNGLGGWGSTQATVLTLQAFTAYLEKAPSGSGEGEVELWVNGQQIATQRYASEQSNPVSFDDFGSLLLEGSNHVELRHQGTGVLPYVLELSYAQDLPANSEHALVSLTTSLEKTALKMGESVRLNAVLSNRGSAGLPMTMVRVGLPGGLRSQTWQLKELVEKGEVAFVETRPRELLLYFRSLAPEASLTIPLDLIASVPGEYMGPASSAYLYYTDEHKNWAQGLAVSIGK